MNSFERIKERKLVQWGMAYLAGAWLALQIVGTLEDIYGLPVFLVRALPVVLAVGFLGALVLAWYHGERGAQHVSGMELGILGTLVVVAGLGMTQIGRGSVAMEPTTSTRGVPAVDERADPPVERASIAVLPFENMSSDPEQEYFSDGLTEELLNVLAQIRGLRVAARTSSFAFKDTDVPVDSIGRALRVAHVMEGSVRTVNGRVRIQAQLIDATTGYRLWSRSYERELADVFALQDEISRDIADQLRVDIASNAPLTKQETADPEAHGLVLRGMAVTRQGTAQAYAQAVDFYRAAIERDPGYARAHALLADRRLWQAYFRYIPREGYEEARAAADRALALDPELADAHIARGEIANLHDWDFARADEHFRRSLDLAPGDARAHRSRAWLLMRMGRQEEAIDAARRAAELDPLSFAGHNGVGLMYLYAGRTERAAEAFEAALALAPESPHVLANLSHAYALIGRHADAIRTVERARVLAPDSHITLASVGRVYALAGRIAEAQRALAALVAQPEVSPYRVATVHAALGDRRRTLAMLEEAVAERDDHASWLAVTPEFEDVRADPGFDRLLRRAGLR